jgi:hypothetical protein
MAELIPVWEVVGATYGGIDKDEIAETFNVVVNWRGEPSLTVQDAARAYAVGRPRMKMITMSGGGHQWVRNAD